MCHYLEISWKDCNHVLDYGDSLLCTNTRSNEVCTCKERIIAKIKEAGKCVQEKCGTALTTEEENLYLDQIWLKAQKMLIEFLKEGFDPGRETNLNFNQNDL